MKTKAFFITVIGVIGILIVSCQKGPQKPTGPPEKVIIGISATSLLPSLVHIARENGYFLEEGIDMEIKGYPAGRYAFAALFEGEVSIATVSGPNIVFKSFERNDFANFSTILGSAQHAKVLVRKDRNITTPKDLIGKKVATTLGTTAHFFMATFFTFNSLDLSDIELVDLKPKQMVDAIVNGDFDAIFTWEPNILNAQKSLGDNAIILPGEVGYEATFSLVSMTDFIQNNPELLKKILKALAKAEEFVENNRDKSLDIIASVLKTDKDSIDKLWDGYTFELSLTQPLLMTMDDQARWVIKEGMTDKKEVPNYLDYIYVDALREVKPEAVTIIR